MPLTTMKGNKVSIDLTFTQDPAWIEKRELMWQRIYEDISEGLSRKQIAPIKKYFMTGEPPKNDWEVGYYSRILFFPLQTPAGHEFCFKNNINSVTDQQLSSLLNGIVGSEANTRGDLTLAEKVELFRTYVGDTYTPDLEFPFCIGDEKERRSFPMSPLDLAKRFYWTYIRWTVGGGMTYPVHAYFTDFLFSLFPYIDPIYLTYRIPSEMLTRTDRTAWDKNRNIRSACLQLNEFMRNVFVQNIKNKRDFNDVKVVLENIKARFQVADESILPQELVEHWQMIVRRNRLYRIRIQAKAESYEEMSGALFMMKAYGLNAEVLTYFSKFGDDVMSKLSPLSTAFGLDSTFNVEDLDVDEEDYRLDLVCTATDDSVVESYMNILRMCAVESVGLELIKEL